MTALAKTLGHAWLLSMLVAVQGWTASTLHFLELLMAEVALMPRLEAQA